MRFHFVVKLPSRNGGHAHIVTGHHEAGTEQVLADVLNSQEFIVVDEFRVDHSTGEERDLGKTVLARRAIGKVRAYYPPARRAPDEDWRAT